MNIKRIAIGTLVTLVVVSIYGTLIWFGMHSDALDTHEREIESLQGELLETAKVNKILQQGLLGDIQELEDRIAASEDDTRSLVADTDRSLRETVEFTEQNLGVSMRDEVDAIHREIADLSGLVADTRLALQQTQVDVDFLAAATVEEVEVTPPPEITLPAVHIPPPELVVDITEPASAACPSSPDNAEKARRILRRAMEKTSRKGSYSFTTKFNIDSEGIPQDIFVSGEGPNDLRKAATWYTRELRWTVEEEVNDCKIKLQLDVE